MKGLKLRFKIPLIIFIVAVILVILWFAFQIKKVTVEDNTFFSENEVAQMYQTKFWQKNTITFFIMDKLGFTKDPDFVRESEITFPAYGEAHVKLYEKTILAGVKYSNHYIYFDREGMVLQTMDEALPDIPYFETEDITDFTLYHTLSTGDTDLLKQMLNLAGRLTYYEIEWDTVEFDAEGAATLHDGEISVKLGKRLDYDEVLSVLPDILKTAKETKKAGEIDLENYTAGGTVIFKEK